MKRLTLALIFALAAPTFAGGPVVVEEDTDTVTAAAPRSDNWIVPVVVALIVIGMIANSSDDAGDTGPKPCTLTVGSC